MSRMTPDDLADLRNRLREWLVTLGALGREIRQHGAAVEHTWEWFEHHMQGTETLEDLGLPLGYIKMLELQRSIAESMPVEPPTTPVLDDLMDFFKEPR